jgi:hypothetical protein
MEAQEEYYMDDQPQRQPAMPFLSPAQQYGTSMLQMTNPEGEIAKMELALKSQIVDREGNLKQVGEPLLNEEGLSSVVGQVQAIVNQNSVMSNLTKQMIEMLVLDLANTLIKDLMVNKYKYQCITKVARDRIVSISLNTSYICLQRAFEQGERGFWGRIQQEIVQRMEAGGNPSGQGFFQKLLGWGNKH